MQLSEKALTADPREEHLITAVTAASLVLLNYLQSKPNLFLVENYEHSVFSSVDRYLIAFSMLIFLFHVNIQCIITDNFCLYKSITLQ